MQRAFITHDAFQGFSELITTISRITLLLKEKRAAVRASRSDVTVAGTRLAIWALSVSHPYELQSQSIGVKRVSQLKGGVHPPPEPLRRWTMHGVWLRATWSITTTCV